MADVQADLYHRSDIRGNPLNRFPEPSLIQGDWALSQKFSSLYLVKRKRTPVCEPRRVLNLFLKALLNRIFRPFINREKSSQSCLIIVSFEIIRIAQSVLSNWFQLTLPFSSIHV